MQTNFYNWNGWWAYVTKNVFKKKLFIENYSYSSTFFQIRRQARKSRNYQNELTLIIEQYQFYKDTFWLFVRAYYSYFSKCTATAMETHLPTILPSRMCFCWWGQKFQNIKKKLFLFMIEANQQHENELRNITSTSFY